MRQEVWLKAKYQWREGDIQWINGPQVATPEIVAPARADDAQRDERRKSERWTRTARSRVFSSSAVVEGTLDVGSDDGKVYAFDAATGTERWTYTTGGAVRSSPAEVDGTVYVGSNDGIGKSDATLFALDAATGAGPAS
ncbi:PQQ-binding-like beta-propeller repeat protein [Streptomyces sp. GbtcB7]|uniref:outer membrane protein assembly factor BamB family protein n=1 Tax=Streptomyces sp. GbtcB7 TaxID=2824752 RepID=UPI001C30CD7E|nr:PQQ-binding-like beta-propeller repeat protein [Streptomyces sp. GbtcB7]